MDDHDVIVAIAGCGDQAAGLVRVNLARLLHGRITELGTGGIRGRIGKRISHQVTRQLYCWAGRGLGGLMVRAGGMDRGGASSDGRGKQGRCCIRLDHKVVLVVAVSIGGISQFY